MNAWDMLKNIARPQYEPPEGASPALREILTVLAANPMVYQERAAAKLVEEPLKKLKSAPAEERVAFIFEALGAMESGQTLSQKYGMKGVVANLFRAGIPLGSLDAVRMVEFVSQHRRAYPYKALLSALEKVTMTPALREALVRLRPHIDEWHGGREMEEIQEQIDTLLGGAKEKPAQAASGWSRQVFQEIDASPKQMLWRGLFLHARSLTQSSASRRWIAEGVEYVDKIGRAEFVESARRWLALGPMPDMPADMQMPEDEAAYQKGFIWTIGAVGETSLAPDVADFAFACFRKIPQLGAVSHRVGNACVNALSAMPGLTAVTQISRLAMRVKYDVARRLIEKALEQAAERNQVGREDLEAMSVPSYGLNADGVRLEIAGECQAKLAVEDGAAVLSWAKGGKPVKSVPAEVKDEYTELLAELKKTAKELQGVLSTQRLRLERQLLSQSFCLFERWQIWYLEHPVTSVFAKRLIWEIHSAGRVQTAMWRQGFLVDWTGNPVAAAPDAAVRLWHPIRSPIQEVLSWRCWLQDRDIRQPFKQAHREVYLLTDAERQTETYSNRFAAHIVRQHQFAALCRERGWQFNLMGEWDSHNTPHLELPQYNLRAEFDVGSSGGADTSGHMIYTTIATDRVQFFNLEPKARRFELHRTPALRLSEIPVVVLSEVMRDLDLLVGVTSIGADPTWFGRLERNDPHAEYWRRFADGDLSESAQNRKSVIETLLPKLAIRDRCRLEGRYLIVSGETNQYKIHLGSGNVLMEPGTRYLCIVRGAGDTAASVSLPFEGDSMLSVILSKAFLLANDTSIKDQTILNQIRRP